MALSSGTLSDLVRLSLGILTLLPPPPHPPRPPLWITMWQKWQRVMKQNIAHNHSRLTMTILLSLFIPWLQHSHVRKVLLTSGKHTPVTPKNPHVAEEADYSQFLVVLNFSFVLQYTHMLVFIYTDAIEINWKSIPWNRKSSCVLSDKDRQVIKTTPARVWSSARQPIIKSYFILTIKTVTSA